MGCRRARFDSFLLLASWTVQAAEPKSASASTGLGRDSATRQRVHHGLVIATLRPFKFTHGLGTHREVGTVYYVILITSYVFNI
jgi:hypothetical protein